MLPIDHVTYKHYQNWYKWLCNIRRYSENTVTAYQIDLNGFLNFISAHNGGIVTLNILENITIQDLRSWMASRLSRQYGLSSTARSVASVRSFYRFLSKEVQINNSAVFHIRIPKKEQLLPKALSREQTLAMLSTIQIQENDLWINKRNLALLLLIYGSGLRISEALSLKMRDITNRQTFTIKGKGGKERILPVLPIVSEAINDYIAHCPYLMRQQDNIFVGKKGGVLQPAIFQKTVKNARLTNNLPDSVTPHAFRHSFATHLLNEGANLRSIQELLGHAKLSTTQHYTKIDTVSLIENYADFHPRK